MKKKLLSVMLVFTMLLATRLTAFAAEEENYDDVARKCNVDLEENTDDTKEYFIFENLNMRLDSNGKFTFSFKREMSSGYFKPAGSSITVYAKATSSTDNETYYIGVYKYNSSDDDTLIKRIKYTANGDNQSYTFTGLNTSSSYYLYFTKPLTSSATITGSGRIASIK